MLKVEVKNASFDFHYKKQKISKLINLEITNTAKEVFEIGDNYRFVNDNYFFSYNQLQKEKKIYVAGNLIIYNADEDIESVKYFGINDEKIGDVIFNKEWEDEYGTMGRNAYLNFRLFVKTEMFDFIYENILNKNKIEYLTVDIDGLDSEYDNFPPYSGRLIWNINETNEPSEIKKRQPRKTHKANLKNFHISFKPLQQIDNINPLEDAVKVSSTKDYMEALVKTANQIRKHTLLISIVCISIAFIIYFSK